MHREKAKENKSSKTRGIGRKCIENEKSQY